MFNNVVPSRSFERSFALPEIKNRASSGHRGLKCRAENQETINQRARSNIDNIPRHSPDTIDFRKLKIARETAIEVTN